MYYRIVRNIFKLFIVMFSFKKNFFPVRTPLDLVPDFIGPGTQGPHFSEAHSLETACLPRGWTMCVTGKKPQCQGPLVLRGVGHWQWLNPPMSDQVLIRPASILWSPGGTPHCLFPTSPGSRICSFVPASPGIVISLTPSPRPGDGQVQYLAGSTDDSCVLSAQTPGAYRSQAGGATPFKGPRPREQGREGGAAAGRCPGQQSKACEVKLESVLRSLVGPRPPVPRPFSPT